MQSSLAPFGHPPCAQKEFRRSALKHAELLTWTAQEEDHVLQNHTALLGSLKSCKDLLTGSRIHADILKRGLLPMDIHVGTALLGLYAKCGALAKALEVFDELPARDVVSWNALIAGYTKCGLGNDALACFARMQDEGISPDAITFVSILKACGSIGAAEKGKEIHAEIDNQGLLEKHVVLGTALVDMYAKCGILVRAQEVFNELPVRNVVSWNVLIAGYAQHGHSDEALKCFGRMRDEGLSPNAATFVCVLRACGSMGAVEKGEEIHTEVSRKGFLDNNVVLGTALVDMYAKCGALAKAQEVFDELQAPDIASWTSLIAGYAQHGFGDEALKCFGQMLDKGLSPNAQTFVCILKACGSIGAIKKGEQIHAEVRKQGLLKNNIVLGAALVDMYAKCGFLAKAQDVFNQLSTRDVALWNALMAGYAQHGLGHEALKCFRRMQDEGLSPNAVTFVTILQACGSIGADEKGEEIHAEVCRHGLLETSNVLGNALVDMYAKCGMLAKAEYIFNELPARDAASWNVLIAGYTEQGLADKALNYFEQMRDRGISPDIYSFVCALKACGSIGASKKGEAIHDEVRKEGSLGKHIVLGNALVDMYAKCGALAKAQAVFDELSARDVTSWNVLLAGYAQHDRSDEAVNCFRRMQDEGLLPNVATFVSILKACGSIGAFEKGEEIHAEVSRQGLLQKHAVLGNTLVHMYAKWGMLAKAQELFDELPARDVASWNALLGGYAQHGLGEEALSYFRQMEDEGVFPDAHTYVCILQACGSIGAVEKGKEIHFDVCRQGLLEKNIVLGTAVVDMYAKCGALEKAQEVFNEIPERDVALWNALMAGYVQHGFNDEALNCFGKMQVEGMSPDTATFVCTMKACGNLGANMKGEAIHAEVNRQGLLGKHTLLGNALVDMYAKCGALAKAQDVFDELPAPDVISWTALIAGYTQLGKIQKVFDSFSKMIGECIEPNVITFVVMLTACSHAGLVEEGQKYFDTMNTVYCIAPTLEHNTCMVDLFSRAGHLDTAISMIEKVPQSDCLPLWSALLGACQKWSNVELGRWVFTHAVLLDEKYAAAYVGMSNIYAANVMQKKPEKVEALGLTNEAWKIPGRCWWTDVKRNVHLFTPGNKSHLERCCIYAKLKNIRESLLLEGYSPRLHWVSQAISDAGQEDMICGNNEKLAIACALINTPEGSPIRVTTNMRICGDCHLATSIISKMEKRKIHVRDVNHMHIFENGKCVCEKHL